MSANEVSKSKFVYPDKLYARTNDNITLDISYAPQTLEAVEYVRTDAFIEKAVSYLNSKLYDWVQTTNPNQRSCANTIMKQDFIEDFRKYMEGE